MEDLISRRLSYIHEPKSTPSIGEFKGDNDIVGKSAEIFVKWFNNLGIQWRRRSRNGKIYLPPLISIIINKKGVLIITWSHGKNFDINKVSDIFSFCFSVGEIYESKGFRPEAFAISVDDKIWQVGREKYLFRVAFSDGRTRMKASDIKEKNGKAALSMDLEEVERKNDITLSASNAFWAGAGMGTRHVGPNISITPNKTPNSDVGYESIDLGSPNSQKIEKVSTSTDSHNTSSSKGSVYVLTNVEIPDKVKIGHTTRSAQERARELSGTGVPGKWRVAYDIDVAQPQQVEKRVHQQLSHLRSQEGEFFEVDPRKAAKVIKKLRG